MFVKLKTVSLSFLFASTILSNASAMLGGEKDDSLDQKSQITGVKAAANLFNQGDSPVKNESTKKSQVEDDYRSAGQNVKKLSSFLTAETEKQAEKMIPQIKVKAQIAIQGQLEEVKTLGSTMIQEVEEALTTQNARFAEIATDQVEKMNELAKTTSELEETKGKLEKTLKDQLITKDVLSRFNFRKANSAPVPGETQEDEASISYVSRVEVQEFKIDDYTSKLQQALENVKIEEITLNNNSTKGSGSLGQLHDEIQQNADAMLASQKEKLLQDEKQKAIETFSDAFNDINGQIQKLLKEHKALQNSNKNLDIEIQKQEAELEKIRHNIEEIKSQIEAVKNNTLLTKSGVIKTLTWGYYGNADQDSGAQTADQVETAQTEEASTQPKSSGWMGGWFKSNNQSQTQN